MKSSQPPSTQRTETAELSPAEKRLAKNVAMFQYLPDEGLVAPKVVCIVRGRSPSSNQRDVKAGRLAPPIRIGPNAVRFRAGDVRLSIKGTEATPKLCNASPEPIGQLGHNGGPPLDDAIKQGDPPVITGGQKKRGGQNG